MAINGLAISAAFGVWVRSHSTRFLFDRSHLLSKLSEYLSISIYQPTSVLPGEGRPAVMSDAKEQSVCLLFHGDCTARKNRCGIPLAAESRNWPSPVETESVPNLDQVVQSGAL